MNSAVNFLIESGVSLALLSLVYLVFLRRETFFLINRIFLLGSILFSVVLPFMKFRIYAQKEVLLPEVTVTPYRNLIEAVTVYGKDFSGTIETAILSVNLIIFIYLAGLTFFLIRFLVRIIQIGHIIRRNMITEVNGVKIVALNQDISPFSFLNYVFISSSSAAQEGYEKIVTHEFEHVRQGHSFDVLMLEILTIFQWFNPAMWMLKRVVRENHEYLADQAVLNSGISRGQYKKLLINQFVGVQFKFASNFNYSLIKNRIRMMSKISSPKISAAKITFGFLAAFGLIIAFACEQSNKKSLKDESVALKEKAAELAVSPEEVFFVVEEMPEFPGGEMELIKFISQNISYPLNAKEKGIQGKVHVSFTVVKDGSIKDVKIARGVDPDLDTEAVRVISQLPDWKPGKQKGIPVNVRYTVPINFVLQ